MNKSFVVIFLLVLLSFPSAFGQDSTLLGTEEGSVSIVWEAVEGAASYRVRIRRDSAVFIDTETRNPELNLDLAPGEYEYQIAVTSPFGNEAAATEWTSLKVQRARTPYFRVTEPVVVWEGDESKNLYLEIINIEDPLDFILTDGVTTVELIEESDEVSSYLPVNTRGLSPGSWDLKALAPSGLFFTHPGAITIRPTRPPVIESTDIDRVSAEGLIPVTINGNSFDDEMTVRFKGSEGNLEVEAVEIDDGTKAIVYLNVGGADPGSYDMILANPAGDETVLLNAITVDALIEETKLKVQPRFEFHIGWAPLVAKPVGSDVLIVGLATFETALTFHSGWTAPFLNGLGVETRLFFGATNYVVDDNPLGITYMFKTDISGYWRPLVRGKAAPVFILGFGNMWSGVAAKYGLENMLFVRFGIGVDFATFSRFTRLGLNFDVGFTDKDPVPMLSLMFRRGFRF